MLDRKTHPLLQDRDTPAGSPLHHILVRLVIDEHLLVHDAGAALGASPFDVCRGAADTLAPLKGLRIGAGWNKRVRELLGGRRFSPSRGPHYRPSGLAVGWPLLRLKCVII